ncbi:unnamed protein product [Hermetia illucens]|uniref:Uncharacterized protein n=1 Tax=Hermetia illucens TaxID=343691 RepID=A0A7R8YMB8_HERIL|nr:unnamed protein product [Hermetia illucens]
MDRTRENSSYKIYNKVILAVTNIFVITATCDLCGSISDYENFLDGACILTAFYMILYKRIEFHVKQSEIEKIINILHKRAQFIFISANERNRKKYCEYLQEEYALIILLGIIAFTLSSAFTFQSSKVAEAAYNCMWIGCPKGFINDLQFIIMRGQKPLAISAYPFYDFDFESFIKILSASCSYFTLIRTLNQ